MRVHRLRKRNRGIREFWIHIIVWLCLFSFPIGATVIEFGRLPSNLIPRMLINPALLYLNYLILVPYILLKKKLGLYILCSAFIIMLANIVIQQFAPPMIFEGFRAPRLQHFPQGRYMNYIITTIFSLAFYFLGGFLGLTKGLYRRERINNEKEVHRQETELRFLRAQLNPHFLFNSLNSIYSLVRNKSGEAPEAVITLSELMRYMLYETKQEFVPLEKELGYIKNYVSLQLLRLSNSENVKLLITGASKDKQIPPLMLIPFIENAFKYGTDFEGKTFIDMRIKIGESQLIFDVANKIGAYKKDLANSGVGLENIKARLKLQYPQKHVLEINKEHGCYHVHLELEHIKKEQYEVHYY